ncbi:MAG: hypothetical protein UT48_C0015G0004 [Parcubacteria group bacterium GW2011_GWE2_39_37]|uniref:Uncharacterized protein n=1 Tax=Candidatus Falkowbacteria bacterium GW2011_GWF2_39_8 TaxID=1618642 RepID=A0A0G0SBX5_9BACT|nr:MAG: hypothetical protein UT48_C0015G0004 [Parcubacteria group bacterium GW2011_GWE2_39_37]KKR32225.1 MAG: hypothetical protein UT64_C0039G0004 [Candidatus Falkowbacteria bacterium GW2011_GWF2_39_8]
MACLVDWVVRSSIWCIMTDGDLVYPRLALVTTPELLKDMITQPAHHVFEEAGLSFGELREIFTKGSFLDASNIAHLGALHRRDYVGWLKLSKAADREIRFHPDSRRHPKVIFFPDGKSIIARG